MSKRLQKISLILPDGSEFQGKKKEIDLKIEEIIGLDVNQFTQIADDRAGRFFEAFACGIKRTKADFFENFSYTDFLEDSGHTERTGKRAVHSVGKKQHGLQAGNGNGCRLHRMMKKNDVWKQLLSLQLPPQKEVLDCVETICQSGEAKEKEQEEKNAQEEKRADAIQMELKNRQNTNHLFELLKKTRDQLEILKGAGDQSGRNAENRFMQQFVQRRRLQQKNNCRKQRENAPI